jgi:hypothetical protein
MKYKVLVAAVILVACPPLPWIHTIARAQTTDQHGWIGTETVKTRFGDFEFKNGYPTAEATDKLYELRTFNRAIESRICTSSQVPDLRENGFAEPVPDAKYRERLRDAVP